MITRLIKHIFYTSFVSDYILRYNHLFLLKHSKNQDSVLDVTIDLVNRKCLIIPFKAYNQNRASDYDSNIFGNIIYAQLFKTGTIKGVDNRNDTITCKVELADETYIDLKFDEFLLVEF